MLTIYYAHVRKRLSDSMMPCWSLKLFKHFALVVLLLAVTQLYACGEDAEKSRRNLETGVVRIDLDGHRFDVPVRYMYYESKVKRGMWATPKKGRTEVGYLSFDVLLPDLRPYYPEDDARWKVRGYGDRVTGSIKKGNTKDFELVVKRKFDGVAKGRLQREKDVYGLIYFSPKGGGRDEYLPIDGRELAIDCANDQELSFLSCKVTSNYRDGIVIVSYYGLSHLPRWREIDDGIRALVDNFGKTAEAETLN